MNKPLIPQVPRLKISDLKAFVRNEMDLGLAPCQIKQDLEEKLTSLLPPTFYTKETIKSMALALYDSLTGSIAADDLAAQIKKAAQAATPPLEPNKRRLLLSQYTKPLVDFLKTDPDGFNSNNKNKKRPDPTLRLLAAFVSTAISSYHHSGWIHYDRKALFAQSSINTLPALEQTKITKKLHEHYQLGMRVVGSNQPIACFKFNWFIPPTTEELAQLSLVDSSLIYQEVLTILGGYIQNEKQK